MNKLSANRPLDPPAHLEARMRTRADVESLCRSLYQGLGQDPGDLIQIRPIDGGWHDALSYEITRKDLKRTRIYRRDLDDNNTANIQDCLRTFS